MPSRNRKKRSKQRAKYLQKRDETNPEKKASVRYKADPEKKKASVRDSWQRYQEHLEENRAAKRQRYQEDLEKNLAAKRKQRYQEDLEKNRAAKRQRYQEDLEKTNRAAKRQRYQGDLEENRAAKRQSTRTIQLHLKGVGIGMTPMLTRMQYQTRSDLHVKQAAERTRYCRGLRTITTTQSYSLYEPNSYTLAEHVLVGPIPCWWAVPPGGYTPSLGLTLPGPHPSEVLSHSISQDGQIVPSFPCHSFFLGHVANVLAMRREMKNEDEPIATIVSKWAADVGNLFVVFFSYHPLVMSTNPEDHSYSIPKVAFDQSVAKSHLAIEGLASVFGQRFMGRSLITTPDYDTWKPRRKLYDPSFKRSSLKELLPKFNECADMFLERLRPYAGGKREVPMKEAFHEVTLDVISKVAFSSEFDKEWNSRRLGLKYTTDAKLSHLTLISFTGAMRSFSFPIKRLFMLVHPQEAEMYHEAILAMRRIGRDCIEKRIKAVTSGEEVPNDILTQILQSSVGVKSVELETLVDDFIAFFVAGQETAAYTLSFAIILIHQHPKVLDHLLSEVEGVLGDRKEVTGDDLDKMKYTEQVIQEVLRLYPIGLPSLSKDSPKGGIVMSGYHIPEGTIIEFWTSAMCRNPEYFDNPDAFDPSRFDADKPKPGPFVYFPFSVGHRSCIGRHFAMIEAKVILARLLQTFKLTLPLLTR
ncbi:hypothetical protein EMCRGX_G018662 [Ephydatia muelleri]